VNLVPHGLEHGKDYQAVRTTHRVSSTNLPQMNGHTISIGKIQTNGSQIGEVMMDCIGAATFETEDEGRRLGRYAKPGSILIKVWFTAARELQLSMNGWAAPDGPDVLCWCNLGFEALYGPVARPSLGSWIRF
jgi:hypothetical protein